jgi:hypothetical protein
MDIAWPTGYIPNLLKPNIMEIYISEEDILLNIQNRFHEEYPYLKLECYLCPHGAAQGSGHHQRISSDTPIEDIRLVHSFGWIDIGGNRTVAQVEKDFYKEMGLAIQVFRRFKSGWLQTTKTDHLTLAEQNARGKQTMTAETGLEA